MAPFEFTPRNRRKPAERTILACDLGTSQPAAGPKIFVLVLDISGSMSGLLLRMMKQAAKRVIQTLTVGDRVAIVPFATDATVIADRDSYLYTATGQNKELLMTLIENLEAGGKTNFYSAFTKAFDLLDASISEELNVPCNSAILFLTDGKMTVPGYITEAQVIDLVSRRIAQTKSMNDQLPILLFTYSVSEHDEGVHSFPSKLACSVEQGMWSKITSQDEIVESLSSYYKLFALGLGTAANADFSAWVEPYEFATGDTLGTTVSVPVYDRSKSTPLFIGVVGMDFSLEALNHALDVTSSTESIRRVVLASTARCPLLTLSPCELDSYRRLSNPEGLCNDFCSEADFVEVVESRCATASDFLPRNLWANTANAGLSYKERVCCDTTADTLSHQCAARGDKSSSQAGLIAGAVVAVVVCVSVLSCLMAAKCMGLCCWAPGIPPVFSEKPAVAVVPPKETAVAVNPSVDTPAELPYCSAPEFPQSPPPLNPNYQHASEMDTMPLDHTATTNL